MAFASHREISKSQSQQYSADARVHLQVPPGAGRGGGCSRRSRRCWTIFAVHDIIVGADLNAGTACAGATGCWARERRDCSRRSRRCWTVSARPTTCPPGAPSPTTSASSSPPACRHAAMPAADPSAAGSHELQWQTHCRCSRSARRRACLPAVDSCGSCSDVAWASARDALSSTGRAAGAPPAGRAPRAAI